MSSLRIALAQINPTVGALRANTEAIVAAARRAAEAGAGLVVFPELAVSGYPPEDLLMKDHFLAACQQAVEELADRLPPGVVAVVGAPLPGREKARNAACVFHGGRWVATYHKMCLPNYGVFDEQRVFEPGDRLVCLQAGSHRIGVHICEDSWITGGVPTTGYRDLDLDLVVNLSASPYHRRKSHLRREALARTAAAVGAPVHYCNVVGGQDELVFDGGSLVVDPGGAVLARAMAFREDLLLVDVAAGVAPAIEQSRSEAVEWVMLSPEPEDTIPAAPRVEPELDPLEEVYEALTLGLRDYVDKNRFPRVVVAISGGIDSALVAALAVDALGAERVTGVTMPSRFSSTGTYQDALELGRSLGIETRTLPIEPLVGAFLAELNPQWPGRAPDVAEENLQARVRGVLIMALSNKFIWLVLATGNKSEMATGYCTLYGDMAGGFAVIKDTPKTLVFDLCRWRNRKAGREFIPASTIERPPSAELRDNQKDSDSLPPYDVLDGILEGYVEEDLDAAALVARGFDRDTVNRVIRLVNLSEYKRRQAAPGVKITPKAFGRDRRMPITNAFRETV